MPADFPRRALLDAYATQRCEVKLQHRLDDEITGASHRSAATQRRIDAGVAHEDAVMIELARSLGGSLVFIDADDRATAQADTLAAMDARTCVIAHGWLPPDSLGRRTGRPDLLVAVDDGYLPVEIKLHLLTSPGHGALESSPLSAPWPSASVPVEGRRLRKSRAWQDDALQLAHYRRMLESLDVAATADGFLGGVIDGSGTLWWIDLDPAAPAGRTRILERYDSLFAERLALADATMARNEDRSLPRAADPWWHKECEGCEFEEVCRDELEATDDVSMVRWSSPETLGRLRQAGITTRTALSELDLELASLARRLSDTSLPMPDLLEEAKQHADTEEMSVVVGRRHGVLRRLEQAGVATVADLTGRAPVSLEICDVVDLDRLIRRARAWRAGGVVRTVHAHELDAARADVEVDIDMESYEHATYLWGALVTARVPVEGIDEGYRAFGEFDRLDEHVEAELFSQLWAWMGELRTEVRRQGRTIRFYCFWRAAEEGQMRRAIAVGGEGHPSLRALERFFASEEWVDLHQVAADQLLTEGPLGLKVLATMAGFSWRDEDPSGEASIAWYEEAARGDLESRHRLLAYNEDDVRATRALREWIDGPVRSLPHLDDVIGLPR